jgi:hypothetical protein
VVGRSGVGEGVSGVVGAESVFATRRAFEW